MPVNPKGLKQLQNLVKRVVEQGARSGAAFTKEVTSHEGSGIKYDFLPNRSSAPGEYPAYQSGTLNKSIQMRKVNVFEARYGAVNATQEIINLEYFPQHMGGRQWLSRTVHDKLNHLKILNDITKLVT